MRNQKQRPYTKEKTWLSLSKGQDKSGMYIGPMGV